MLFVCLFLVLLLIKKTFVSIKLKSNDYTQKELYSCSLMFSNPFIFQNLILKLFHLNSLASPMTDETLNVRPPLLVVLAHSAHMSSYIFIQEIFNLLQNLMLK